MASKKRPQKPVKKARPKGPSAKPKAKTPVAKAPKPKAKASKPKPKPRKGADLDLVRAKKSAGLSDEEKLRALLEAHELGARANAILATVLPSIRLVAKPAAEESIALGATKIGGAAHLPAGAEWPTNKGAPLAFLAQLDLGALARLMPQGPLAKHEGLLSFFFDAKEQPWGFPSDGLDGIRVLHHPPRTKLVRRSEGNVVFTPVAADTFVEPTIPHYRTARARALVKSGRPFEHYADVVNEWANEGRHAPRRDGDVHRVLGHPDAIQGDMTRRLEYGLRGFDLEKEVPSAESAAQTWRLLLQVDSEDACKMMWGDLGRVFFWIREDDLRAGDWSKVHYQLQCG